MSSDFEVDTSEFSALIEENARLKEELATTVAALDEWKAWHEDKLRQLVIERNRLREELSAIHDKHRKQVQEIVEQFWATDEQENQNQDQKPMVFKVNR